MRATRNRCKCGHEYESALKRRCPDCGHPRKPKSRAKHMAALDQPMAAFVEANDDYNGCWVCRHMGIELAGKPQRDHWHTGPRAGEPRGVLCPYHNLKLGPAYTLPLLRAYVAYLARHEVAQPAPGPHIEREAA